MKAKFKFSEIAAEIKQAQLPLSRLWIKLSASDLKECMVLAKALDQLDAVRAKLGDDSDFTQEELMLEPVEVPVQFSVAGRKSVV